MEIIVRDILAKGKYLGLPVSEQDRYVDKKIQEILHDNHNGISISDIASKTPFTRPTILKHLESLVSCREAYKIKHGNFSMYYPNGKAVYPQGQLDMPIDDNNSFKGTVLQNNYGRFIFMEVQGNEEVSGGSLLVRVQDFPLFIDFVDNIRKGIK